MILNTPHNPTGKMFTVDELTAISAVVQRHPGVIVIADEVYENIVFDGNKHVHIASLPGMYVLRVVLPLSTVVCPGLIQSRICVIRFERTLTMSSFGKTFSATGWKVGTVVGPVHLIKVRCM